MPASLIRWPVWPVVCAEPLFHIILVAAVVDITIWEDKHTITVLFIVLELPGVYVSTREGHSAISMHLVLPEVAGVDTSLRISQHTMSMPLTVHLVSFVGRIRHLSEHGQLPREVTCRMTHRDWAINTLKATQKLERSITCVQKTLQNASHLITHISFSLKLFP